MLCQINIPLRSGQNLRYGWSSASVLHGVLMEIISPEYACRMHEQGSRPFHQAVLRSENTDIWSVSALEEEACQEILLPLRKLSAVQVHQKQDILYLEDPSVRQTDYDELLKQHYIYQEPSRLVTLEFQTPTAFKSAGNYVNMPTPRLILSGLAKRYDMTCQVHETMYEQLFEEIEQRVTISSYRLQSSYFSLEGIRIPAFTGSVTMYIAGNATFRSYVNMLCEYAVYSGIGIKTALGMGHVSFRQTERRNVRG
ncbi:MAG: CRISPR system precrRNA processing endoribonuclease RAMP protein Cas6 [Oscillospiraceae bacterium]|nr:CRISPR system precrRNA processing endoribonuclease RAMP protein Cas6 [Oscillospiraceae bacterium]MBR1530389.1 CRISPR system precrRNA processing endoribonuclease RAMP protein Cas6 [Oscillospiraceae bacterium]